MMKTVLHISIEVCWNLLILFSHYISSILRVYCFCFINLELLSCNYFVLSIPDFESLSILRVIISPILYLFYSVLFYQLDETLLQKLIGFALL
jgi:hypothetical protein